MASIWYSPLGAIAVGPAGPPSTLAVGPHPSPSTVLKVTATAVVTENDFQWVLFGLVVPAGKITSVRICYKVETAKAGTTYISQVRLTKTTVPTSALVVHDDGTNLTSTRATCYVSKADLLVDGAITLALKMVFGSTADLIRIGGIELGMA
jgi:hypothetical protein